MSSKIDEDFKAKNELRKGVEYWPLIIVLAFSVLTFSIGYSALYTIREFFNETTPMIIAIKSPKPGIECATMITGDGAAIDCWKVEME